MPGLEPGDTLDQAITKAERARFLAETGIDHCYPQVDIYFTRPGGFKQVLEHVQLHRRLMEQDNPDGGEVSLRDAACDWYEHGYLPIVDAIRERQLLRRYPGRTAADLYVWIWGYVFEAYRLFGEKVTPEEGVEMLELRAESPWRQARARGDGSSGRAFGRPPRAGATGARLGHADVRMGRRLAGRAVGDIRGATQWLT